jgi:dolichol-phosphate mannosyltransferase
VRCRARIEARALSDYSTTDVVVPTFNELSAVPELLERMRRSLPGATYIFVDNASTDGTAEFLAGQPDVRLIRHDRNLGYGQSIMDGMRAGDGEFILHLDADLEYFPEDLPALVEALNSHDAVYGSRFLGRSAPPSDMEWWRALGNRILNVVFNVLYRQAMTDIYTGIRGYRRPFLDLDGIVRTDWAMIAELTTSAVLRGGLLGEVPARYQLRATGASKMKHANEFFRFVWLAVRWRFTRPERAAHRMLARPD